MTGGASANAAEACSCRMLFLAAPTLAGLVVQKGDAAPVTAWAARFEVVRQSELTTLGNGYNLTPFSLIGLPWLC
jgi:hypothetical protein